MIRNDKKSGGLICLVFIVNRSTRVISNKLAVTDCSYEPSSLVAIARLLASGSLNITAVTWL